MQDSAADPFQLLDRSLNEDLREYGEVIVDQLRTDFRKGSDQTTSQITALETALAALKQALMGHRTFIQEWMAQSDRRFSDWEAAGRGFDRKSLRRTKRVSSQLRQQNVARKEDQSHIEESLQGITASLEALENLHREYRKQSESEIHKGFLAQEAQTMALRSQILEGLQTTEGALEKNLSIVSKDLLLLTKEHQAETVRSLAALNDRIEEEFSRISKSQEERLLAFEKNLQSSHERRMTQALDDLATLLAAQRGNWNQVLEAASHGSSEAAKTLRQLLAKDLSHQLHEIAKLESEGLKKVSDQAKDLLIRRIESQLSPWPRRASVAAVFLSMLTFAVVPFLFSYLKNGQENLGSKWAASQTTQVAEPKPAETIATLAPKVAPEEKLFEKIPVEANVSRGNLLKKEVAFTFDGGSNSKAAMEILDILKANQIRTTMFLTGEFIESHPNLVRRIVEDGHEVGNHLYRHAHLIDPVTRVHYTQEQLIDEMKQVERVFFGTTGKTMSKLWRAPYGEVSQKQIEWARQKGYVHVGWTKSQGRNLDTQDWVSDPKNKLFRTPAQIAKKIVGFEKDDQHGLNGAIILMHLGSERAPEAMAHLALPDLFKLLHEKGYRFVPITAMLKTELAQNSISPQDSPHSP